MKKFTQLILISSMLAIHSNCHAGGDKTYSYDKEKKQITVVSAEGKATLSYNERNEGNSWYFFDFFGGSPAIVHQNNSLDSYTTYSILNYKNNNFFVNCMYAELKSNKNGVYYNEGRCGLNKIIDPGVDLTDIKFDEVVISRIDNNNELDTLDFINGKNKKLPIMLYRSHDHYIYQTYKTKHDFLDGKHIILSCKDKTGRCESYDEKTWVVILNKQPLEVAFKQLNKLNEEIFLNNATPIKIYDIKNQPSPPFEVTSDKAYFYDASFNKLKSYLIKKNKITLLYKNETEKWCRIRYLNEKNQKMDGNMKCADLLL